MTCHQHEGQDVANRDGLLQITSSRGINSTSVGDRQDLIAVAEKATVEDEGVRSGEIDQDDKLEHITMMVSKNGYMRYVQNTYLSDCRETQHKQLYSSLLPVQT